MPMPTMSPRTEQFMQPQGGQQDEDALFEQGFSQAAEGMLINKTPELANSIVNFKILTSDIEGGSACGVFIAQVMEDVIFIPAILLENELKPLEIMYSKRSGTFLPLMPEWLHELEKNSVEPLGGGVQTPETLDRDVDIANLVRPPMEGRFSFASAKEELLFPQISDKLPNATRQKLAHTLVKHPEILKMAVSIYGQETVRNAVTLRTEKVASAKGLDVFVATKITPVSVVKDYFGSGTKDATKHLMKCGYAVFDKRAETNEAVNIETPISFEDVTSTGFYKILKSDGTLVKALVIKDPIDISCENNNKMTYGKEIHHATRKVRNQSWGSSTEHTDAIPDTDYNQDRLTVLTEGGEYKSIQGKLIGEPLNWEQVSNLDVYKPLLESTPTGAKAKSYGIFVRKNGTTIEATEPVYVDSVYTDTEGVKHTIYYSRPVRDERDKEWMTAFHLITDARATTQKLRSPSGNSIRYLPASFSFIPCSEKDYNDSSFIRDPYVASSMLLEGLVKAGSAPLVISRKSDNVYLTSGDPRGRGKVATLMKLVYKHDLRAKTAEDLMAEVDAKNSVKVLLIDPVTKIKLAAAQMGGGSPWGQQMGAPQGAMPQEMPMQQQMPQPGAMDPAMQGQMDPSMGMMPPQPSPLDMAIQEVQEKLVQLHEDKQSTIQQQIEALETQLKALEAVGARTEEIAQGVPKEQSPSLHENEGLDPTLMQQSGEMFDPSMFDTSMVSSLANSATLSEAVVTYIPTMMRSLDHLGRILLTFWIKGPDLKKELGDEKYHALEDRLRTIFKGVGELILNLHQNALIVRQGDEFNSDLSN